MKCRSLLRSTDNDTIAPGTMNRRAFCLSSVGALGTLLAGASGCGNTTRRPNIVLIVLDTVRADHVSHWGYHRRTTPNLDKFSLDATAYRRAYSTSPWTLPAHATLFTGLYSFQHGVEAILERDAEGKEMVREPPLPDSAITVAEILKAEGYATAAFTANTAYMSAWTNLGQGFDVYDVQRRPGVEMTEPISSWLRTQHAKPFFLFVNYIDAHFQYNTKPCPGAFDEPVSQDKSLIIKLADAVMPGIQSADAQLVKEVTAQYDLGIANADLAMGQVLDYLKQSGLYDDSVVFVTSDHGEFLGEHLYVQHSKDLYEEVLRVPLLVKAAGQSQGTWCERPVSLVQLFGAVLDAAQAGQTLTAPSLDATAPLLAEIHYTRNYDFVNPIWGHRFRRLRTAYYEYPWKLIRSSDGHHELYNVEEDPKEATNRFGEIPDLASQLAKGLASLNPLSDAPPAPAATPSPGLSEQDKEALKANGYL